MKNASPALFTGETLSTFWPEDQELTHLDFICLAVLRYNWRQIAHGWIVAPWQWLSIFSLTKSEFLLWYCMPGSKLTYAGIVMWLWDWCLSAIRNAIWGVVGKSRKKSGIVVVVELWSTVAWTIILVSCSGKKESFWSIRKGPWESKSWTIFLLYLLLLSFTVFYLLYFIASASKKKAFRMNG